MKIKIITITLLSGMLFSCGGPEDIIETNEDETSETEAVVEDDGKGVGPITNIELGDIDDAMAAEGEEIFKANCTACHKISKRSVGPALGDVTTRRSPEWIMNMILNPEEMVANDPEAKALLAEYLSPMANQSLTEAEARSILEYLRTKN